MPEGMYIYWHGWRTDRRKKWRYPGVPIPWRLRDRYKP